LKNFALAVFLLFVAATFSEERKMEPLSRTMPAGITPGEIVQKFAAREKEFKEAREKYTYRQYVVVQTIDDKALPDGEYRQVTDILFNDKGKRIENVVYAPRPTLKRIGMTQEDFDDLEHRMPFVLTSDEIDEYDILYIGRQHIDELNTYVFDIAPKEMKKGKRYFKGRIWVDAEDFQIVLTKGKNVPDIHGKQENLFPAFTTYREQIDGKYWFPTYTHADDVLKFSNNSVRIKMTVTYKDYKRFGTKVKIIFDGQQVEKKEEKKEEKK